MDSHDDVKYIFFVIILLFNVLFYGYWAFRMGQQIRLHLAKFHEKVFFYICACKKEERVQKVKEELKRIDCQDKNKQEVYKCNFHNLIVLIL